MLLEHGWGTSADECRQTNCTTFLHITVLVSEKKRDEFLPRLMRTFDGWPGKCILSREWKNGWQIHYRTAGTEGPPLLLLTGFGVGGFHYSRNFAELSKTHRVWTMDVLGQFAAVSGASVCIITCLD